MPGEDANEGTARIAEDGFPGGDLPPESGGLADLLADAEIVSDSGTFASPGGPMENPALFPGESAEFSIMASPEDNLTFETMFVQSNDWFYGLDLALYDGENPIEGDVTDELVLYDAGTEKDARPGHGPEEPPGPVQKPVQDPMASNVGTDENEPIQRARKRHPDFTIPDTDEVIEVTISL